MSLVRESRLPESRSAFATPNGATLVDALLLTLRDHGARAVFGIPGDYALPLFREIERSGVLPLYTMSHEPALGFAADAAARIGGGLGVAAVTYGAGALNLVNAVAGAYAERSPVIVISGAPSRAERLGGLLVHHQVRTTESQLRVFQEITCDQAVIDDTAGASKSIARVLRTCIDRSLPGYIEIPRDLAGAPGVAVAALPGAGFNAEAAASCAEEVLAHLGHARAPVLMVGVEVRRHGVEDKVAELARRLGVPVVTSFMGRGLLAGANSPVLGTYMGRAGHADISELVEEADALILLGVIISDTNFGISARQIDLRKTVHAFDRQVRIGHHIYHDVPLAALVDAMLERVPTRGQPVTLHRRTCYAEGLTIDEAPVQPADIARAVNDLMRVHGRMPIAADVGDCLFTAMEIEHTHLVAPGYYAGMGFGVPAGLGIQAATGQRPLILVGDGAFQMTGWELGNCRRYGWDPIVLVLNNQGWGMLRAFEPEASFTRLDDWHFADIAPSLGGVGRRVSTRAELMHALDLAYAGRGRFQLIEVMLAKGAISTALARFAEAVRRQRE
jgi:indolepyruvate decarboxylase